MLQELVSELLLDPPGQLTPAGQDLVRLLVPPPHVLEHCPQFSQLVQSDIKGETYFFFMIINTGTLRLFIPSCNSSGKFMSNDFEVP